MKFRERRRDETLDVNITPLIDVVFLMLIFFMVSSTFIKESHLDLDLPEAETAVISEIPDGIDVVIDRDGQFLVNETALSGDRLSLRQALSAFSNKKDVPVTISADQSTRHQAVVMALDVASELGYTKIHITTQLNESGP